MYRYSHDNFHHIPHLSWDEPKMAESFEVKSLVVASVARCAWPPARRRNFSDGDDFVKKVVTLWLVNHGKTMGKW